MLSSDLHIHTAFSDGFDSPAEIVREAANRKLSVIGITDNFEEMTSSRP
ncbi:MAG: PHP domain-containing protein [archaeon]